ncbi:MAG: HlyD family efflux transporter periplasmic adaptor subunit [Chloroflexi bacterium]|nr:MAG: HlyD family efflux transporter periplasmic adaptor subunit [Chloroflexota bacterium]
MKRIIPIVIILGIIAAGYWWYTQQQPAAQTADASTALVGSGTIEAETVLVTAELGGRVIEVKVDEGDEVSAGQVLVELDRSDLLAQKLQLEAALSTARANLELVSAPPRQEDIAAARAQLAQAEAARDGAKRVWEKAQALVDDPHELEARITQAQAQVTEAEKNLEAARINLKRAEIQAEAASRNQSSHQALVEAEIAQKQLEAARVGVQMAEAALQGAQRQVEHLTRLRLMPLALIAQAHQAESAYRQAEAAVQVARANLNAVLAGATEEDIAVAQAQVQEAQAALEVVEARLAKQTLTAPRAGIVSRRLVEPGELAAPGTALLELADIETVEMTVYIPETRIGQVKPGQLARVYPDAYEGEVFEGVVTFIAHEAEFTPRNVQTKEERVNLVFAVKITLDNADHRLKPGMPADAEILPEMAPASMRQPSEPPQPPTATPAPTATSTPTPVPAPSPSPTLQPTSRPAAAAIGRAEVTAWGLNVRAAPGVDQPVTAHLSQGDVVPVLAVDEATGWLKVQLASGQIGWITGSETYVKVEIGD